LPYYFLKTLQLVSPYLATDEDEPLVGDAAAGVALWPLPCKRLEYLQMLVDG